MVQGPHTQLVVGASGDPRNKWLPAAHLEASFKLPQVKSEAQGVHNDYLAPPAPKCICWKEFLPPLNPMFPSQDFREGQSQKTLDLCTGPTILGGEGQPTDTSQTNYTFWPGVCKNWGGWWNIMWPSLMMPSWREPHLRRDPQKDEPGHPSQWRPRYPPQRSPLMSQPLQKCLWKRQPAQRSPLNELAPAEVSTEEVAPMGTQWGTGHPNSHSQ